MATIKQVADKAGVSTATVSYVLNGTGTVTEAVRQRVLDAATTLDYQPSYAARSLRTRSRTLGLVLSERLADPVFVELLAGLAEVARTRKYDLLLATADSDLPEHLLCQRLVRSGRVDGVVLRDILVSDERVSFLQAQGVPHVCAGPLPADSPSLSVAVDGRAGASVAVRHLIALGYQRIGLIALPSEFADSEPRYLGYLDALEAAGLNSDPQWIVEAGRTQEDGYTAMQALLELPEAPDAVLACSDELAFGAMHALRDAGLEVGRDVSLVGWDDAPLAAHTHPPLTTLHASHRKMGTHLAQLLIAAIEKPDKQPTSVTMHMRLIVRKSTSVKREMRDVLL